MFSFSEALENLKLGKKVARIGWNGKGMWLYICTSYDVYDIPFNYDWNAERGLYPFIIMKTADNKLVPWLASQTDVLAEDWNIVD
jgi:hypothetical protein